MINSHGYKKITDPVRFIRELISALEDRHKEKKPHGQIGKLAGWISKDGEFDKALFDHDAVDEDRVRPDTYTSDVEGLYELSVRLVTENEVDAGTPFSAALYKTSNWPSAFLDKLEEFSKVSSEQHKDFEVTDFLLALSEPTKELPPAAANSEPAACESELSEGNDQGQASKKVETPKEVPKKVAKQSIVVQLKNGTVGKPYEYEAGKIAKAIAVNCGDDPEKAFIQNVKLPEGCGIVFDENTGAISGSPSFVFEQEIDLQYFKDKSSVARPIKVKILINPDPASLWKDLPTPADSPYQKKNTDHQQLKAGNFEVFAASRRGRSHATKGDFRDDDFSVGFCKDTGWVVVAVGDGAGSAKYSRKGSQLATDTSQIRLSNALCDANNSIDKLLNEKGKWDNPEVTAAVRGLLYDAALAAHYKLVDEAKSPSEKLPAEPHLRNFDTTLILLILKKIPEGTLIATFSIGDGGAGAMVSPEEGLPLTHQDSGEHAGQTVFLTFPSTLRQEEQNLAQRFHMVCLPEFVGAIAMTDGITDPKFPSDASYAEPTQWGILWKDLQSGLASAEHLLEWMNFLSPGNHDDRTLVAIVPKKANSPANEHR
jgi:hypothetical protein